LKGNGWHSEAPQIWAKLAIQARTLLCLHKENRRAAMENNTPSTNNFLNWVDIKNFKSIKDLHLDCKRVNVFIGKPNVGKSNILEGLGLLGASYDDKKYLSGAVRYETLINLFYDADTSNRIEIRTDNLKAEVNRINVLKIEDSFELAWTKKKTHGRIFYLTSKGQWGASLENTTNDDDLEYQNSPVRKYDFFSLATFSNSFGNYLLPPYGWNLYEVVKRNQSLFDEFYNLFSDQQLEFILSESKRSFVLQKKEGSTVIQHDFFSIPSGGSCSTSRPSNPTKTRLSFLRSRKCIHFRLTPRILPIG
jgi:hypothetical protein